MASTPTRPRPAARRRAAPRPELDVQRFVFEDASWGLYERLLREVGDGPTRLTHDQGRLEIRSPLPGHGEISRVLCLFVFDLALASGQPIRMLGSTTLRRRLRRRGLEQDECFYIANEPRVRGKQRLSIPRDPPPDLAVEIDVTNSSIDRMPIYAALGVPEVWRYSRQRLRCLHLRAATYVARPRSLSFPALRPDDLTPFLRQAARAAKRRRRSRSGCGFRNSPGVDARAEPPREVRRTGDCKRSHRGIDRMAPRAMWAAVG